MKLAHLPALALAAALAAFLPLRVDAATYVMMTDEALVATSQSVVVVTVDERLPARDGDRETLYRVRVERTLAGSVPASRQLLALPGTFDAPSLNFRVFGVPVLREGETYLLFASRRADGTLALPELALAVFGRVGDGDHAYYARDLAANDELHAGSKSRRARYHALRDADAFERWIVDQSRGLRREPDYLRPDASLQAAKFNLFTTTFDGVTRSGRWMQFDSGTVQQWTADEGGQAGMTSDIFVHLQSALAAWTNDPGSRILMAYQGTGAGFPEPPAACWGAGTQLSHYIGPQCFRGHVYWNNLSRFGGQAFDCGAGGVLALGGKQTVSIPHDANGHTWWTNAQAEVWVRAGTACVLNGGGGSSAAELLAHEVGHSLGFRHACRGSSGDADLPNSCASDAVGNAALMRPNIHGGGRGATLGDDDRAGAAFVYHDPSAVGPTIGYNSPAQGVTTVMPGGAIGAVVTRQITFSKSGGSGGATTAINCTPAGAASITANANQTVTAAGSVAAVTVAFTLTTGAQNGAVNCTVTPQGAAQSVLTYNFTAPPGVRECTGTCVLLSGFEPGE